MSIGPRQSQAATPSGSSQGHRAPAPGAPGDGGEPQGGLSAYLRRMRGTTRGPSPRVSRAEILCSWLGAVIGITGLAWVAGLLDGAGDRAFLISSFGASAVLLFGAPRSPLAQPRNLVGGHLVSALTGVIFFKLSLVWSLPPGLAEGLAVATAIALMHLSRTLHPPGGATALIAVTGSDALHALGFSYVLAPVGLGAALLLATALLVNNACPGRRYPETWR